METLGMRFGVVSNWGTFHYDVNLDGCQVGEHVPIVDSMALPKNSILLYRPRSGALAAMVVAGEKTHQAFRRHDGFREKKHLGGILFEFRRHFFEFLQRV